MEVILKALSPVPSVPSHRSARTLWNQFTRSKNSNSDNSCAVDKSDGVILWSDTLDASHQHLVLFNLTRMLLLRSHSPSLLWLQARCFLSMGSVTKAVAAFNVRRSASAWRRVLFLIMVVLVLLYFSACHSLCFLCTFPPFLLFPFVLRSSFCP